MFEAFAITMEHAEDIEWSTPKILKASTDDRA